MFRQIPRCLGSWSPGPSRRSPDDASWARGGHTALGSGGRAGGPGTGGRLLGGPGTRSWKGLGRPAPLPHLRHQGRPVISHLVGEPARRCPAASGFGGGRCPGLQAGLPSAWSLDPTLLIDAPKRAPVTGRLGRARRTLPRWRRWDKALPLLGVDLDGRQPPFALALVAATGVTRVPQLKATQKGLEGTVGLSTPHQASASDGWGLERGS